MYQTEPSFGPWWRCCGKRTKPETTRAIDPTLAVSVQGLGKTFNSFCNRKSKQVTAIADLTINVPRSGIFVLLGSNGAGKSTFLDILGGLTRPSRGVTLRVWQAVKWSTHSVGDEDLEQLLRDCDLEHKIHANASTLSGGQKRKLQLAIGIVGGSKLLLVDECTSGVDPLSRRAIWRVLVSLRQKRTILLTTHLLDEADLLADHIAILAAPGKLVASDSPVALKKDLGKGYTVQATLVAPATDENTPLAELLRQIRAIAPNARMSLDSPQRPLFHLETQDPAVVGRVLALLDAQSAAYGIVSYDVLGATIEDIFLDVMARNPGPVPAAPVSSAGTVEESATRATSADELVPMTELHPGPQVHNTPATILHLADGKPISPLRQSLTIFYKRVLIFRRSWLAPLLGIGIAVAGAVILASFRRLDQVCRG
ncbi:P-loop containing nucleoside triphosphate hydrolase protein [Mycena leptocephala]|nr:P-loop containing nucleoside triphosphate hydrolase protein [Mycena leptocephala]